MDDDKEKRFSRRKKENFMHLMGESEKKEFKHLHLPYRYIDLCCLIVKDQFF
jgi:ferredoxin-fold anticodon binding domain-containing protein